MKLFKSFKHETVIEGLATYDKLRTACQKARESIPDQEIEQIYSEEELIEFVFSLNRQQLKKFLQILVIFYLQAKK